MNKSSSLKFIVLLLLVAGFGIYLVANIKITRQKADEKIRLEEEATIHITGVVRELDLNPDESQRMRIKGVKFMLSDLSEASKTAVGDSNGLVYLRGKPDSTQEILGKCAEVSGIVDEAWKQNLGENAYGAMLEVKKITRANYEDCSGNVYNAVSDNSPYELLTFEGRLTRFKRVYPDIGYDYKIDLNTPYIDNTSASGIDTPLDFLVTVPADPAIWELFENYIDKPVKIKGYVKWGYSESKYLEAVEVKR